MWNKQVNGMENVMGKMKVCLLVLTALLILVLVPVVSADENGITFVFGKDENRASLFNASENVSVSINIYNVTQACSMDFANESVVFLASLNDETVACINSTVNKSASIITHNLSVSIDIGNVKDMNITKYWVYGGDENIENLVMYMDNAFFGNKNVISPPEISTIIFLVTGHGMSLDVINEASKEMEDLVDVSAYRCCPPYYSEESKLPDTINLSTYDVIVVCGWTYDTERMPDLPSKLDAAKEHTNVIVMDSFAISPGNVNLGAYPDIHKYWDYGVKENCRRLVTYLGVNFCNLNAIIEPPLSIPDRAIYHPDSPIIFDNMIEYLEWYETNDAIYHTYNPENITIGIAFTKSHYTKKDLKPIDSLIRTIEAQGYNVIPLYGSGGKYDIDKFFSMDGESEVDSIITTYYNFGNEVENFKALNVPVLYGIGAPYKTPTEWEVSSEGVTPRLIQYYSMSEIYGLIEPTVIYARVIDDETTGAQHYEPIDYQITYITDRAISWGKLRYMDNSDKKVVITWKNDESGKANLGTCLEMYLDVPASIEELLHQMQERGYNVGDNTIPDANNITNLMVEKGRNIGEWAPGELNTRVETGDPILIPESRYLEWFSELPDEQQKEVIKYWGKPPGDLMVWQNSTGKYIVIPRFQFGNVLVTPHPIRPGVVWQLS